MQTSVTQREKLLDRIYHINEKEFNTVAVDVARYQYNTNKIYQQYCNLLGISPLEVEVACQMPFLPISMFKEHSMQSNIWEPEVIFQSSGTTGSKRSRHFVRDIKWYQANALKTFDRFFGTPANYTWIALLPSYIENGDSSLISMVHSFMMMDKKEDSQFYPSVDDSMIDKLGQLFRSRTNTILIGVSFALLDLFENYDVPVWNELLVVETGGMKGRSVEITREELHARIKAKHPLLNVSSEYGMTELLSQAYMINDHFRSAETMKIFTRDISDPISLTVSGKRGCINIIDLANIDTCSFIATEDIGIAYEDGSFDVLGRLDAADIRGCNLLYA